MRWPSGAVSLVGRSLNLDTGKTYNLMRRLRKWHSVTYLTKLWQLTLDRAGKRDDAESRRRLKIDWAETKRRLGTHGRNAKRQLMWLGCGYRAPAGRLEESSYDDSFAGRTAHYHIVLADIATTVLCCGGKDDCRRIAHL